MIKQNEYDKEKYDLGKLTALLEKTEIVLKGYIELVLHECEAYQIIYMTRTD